MKKAEYVFLSKGLTALVRNQDRHSVFIDIETLKHIASTHPNWVTYQETRLIRRKDKVVITDDTSWVSLEFNPNQFAGLLVRWMYYLEGTVLRRVPSMGPVDNKSMIFTSSNKRLTKYQVARLWQDTMTPYAGCIPETVDLGGQSLALTRFDFDLGPSLLQDGSKYLWLRSELDNLLSQRRRQSKVFVSTI